MGAALTFVKAIFFGAAAGASVAYQVAVGLARLALLSAASKKLTPKVDLSATAQDKLLTVKSTIAPQAFVYGEDMLSGPLLFAQVEDNDKLHRLVALTGREIDSFQGFRIDDETIDIPDDIPDANDTVTGGLYADVTEIATQLGTATQTALSQLTTAFSSLWTSAHRGRGWSQIYTKMTVEGNSDAFESGIPQNIRALVRGNKVYDPRKYALNADPDFATIDLGVGGGLRWFHNNTQTAVPFSAHDSASAAAGVLTITDNDDTLEDFFSERIPVDLSKKYTIRVDARQTAGTRRNYLGVVFYDSAGDWIDASLDSATGWDSKGSYFYTHTNAVFAGTWTTYSMTFGVGGSAQFPQDTTAVEMAFVVLGPGTSATSGDNTTIELRDAAIFEGTSRHDVDDSTTWEWSDNNALCLADFLIWDEVGYGEDPARIDWEKTIEAAQICDERADVPPAASPANTQKRYTANYTFYADQARAEVKQTLEQSMLGRCIFSQGKWRMFAGAARTPSVTLSEENLGGDEQITIEASASSETRYNRVRGKFIDPSRNYQAAGYPEVVNASYETDDGGLKPQTFDFNACNDSFECQRNAIKLLRQSRNQQIIKFPGNWSCFRLQTGDVVELNFAELGFSATTSPVTTKKYLITEKELRQDFSGVTLTLREETDSVWTDPAVGDYTTRTATGELVPPASAAVQLSDATISNERPNATAYAGVRLAADGRAYYQDAGGGYSDVIVPPKEWRAFGTSEYFVRVTVNSGSLDEQPTSSPAQTWYSLSTDRSYSINQASPGIQNANITLDIALDITTSPVSVLATGTYDLTAEYSAAAPVVAAVTKGNITFTGASDQDTVTIPSNSTGDALIIFFASAHITDSYTVDAPTGWTKESELWNSDSSGDDRRIDVFTKISGGSEGNVTMESSDANPRYCSYIAVAISGADSGIWDASPNRASHYDEGTDDPTPTPPAITTLTNNALAIVSEVLAGGNSDTLTPSAPSGYTLIDSQQHNTAALCIALARKDIETAGTETPGPFQVSGEAGTEDWIAGIISVKPG